MSNPSIHSNNWTPDNFNVEVLAVYTKVLQDYEKLIDHVTGYDTVVLFSLAVGSFMTFLFLLALIRFLLYGSRLAVYGGIFVFTLIYLILSEIENGIDIFPLQYVLIPLLTLRFFLFRKLNDGIRSISTKNASPAGGHYSQAVVCNGLLFVSGLLPINTKGEKLAKKSFAEQTKTVLDNLEGIITAAGCCDLSSLVKVTVYIEDIEKWGEFNRIYSKRLGNHKPARVVVPVPKLHYGLALELAAVANV
eukprot:g1886.t1